MQFNIFQPSIKEETVESEEAVITEIPTDEYEQHQQQFNGPVAEPSALAKQLLDIDDLSDVAATDSVVTSDVSFTQLPPLLYPTSVPNVKWQQCESMILLTIEAPDIIDYYLKVTTRDVHYAYVSCTNKLLWPVL